MTTSNKEIAALWFSEYWGKGNASIVDELGADDIHFYYPLTGALDGKVAVKVCIQALFAAFPDIVFTPVGDFIAEGEWVAGRWKGEGTQTGEFAGIPATGRRVSFTGTTVYRVTGGKIAEELGEEDALLVLKQLGVVPE
jgi:steroid delta-isomerase-like uncharacterized protein